MKLCPTCQRHVRPSLASCPFCSAALPTFAAAPGQLSRVLGLGLGFAVASCGPSDPSSDDSSTTTTNESTGRGDASSGSVPADSTTTGPLPGTSGVVDSSSGPPATTDGTTTSSDDDTDDGPVGFYGGFDFDSG